MDTALSQFNVVGPHTNVDFLRRLVKHPAFINAELETGFIQKYHEDLIPPKLSKESIALATVAIIESDRAANVQYAIQTADPFSPWASIMGKRFGYDNTKTIQFFDEADKPIDVKVTYLDNILLLHFRDQTVKISQWKLENGTLTMLVDNTHCRCPVVRHNDTVHIFGAYPGTLRMKTRTYERGQGEEGSLLSPIPGEITKVLVKPGQKVEKGETVIVMVSMKMEFAIKAPEAGIITKINYNVGNRVLAQQLLAELQPLQTEK